jgi:TATA-binding protein-associated factor Taf7
MAKKFEKQLNDLNTTFSLATQEYISSYPNAKIFPGSPSYQAPFKRDRQTISNTRSDLFELDAVVNSTIDEQMKEVTTLDKKINEVRLINEKLEQELATLKASDRAAIGRYANNRERSYLQVYVGLSLCVIAAGTYMVMARPQTQ